MKAEPLRLRYSAPFDWQTLLRFFASRATPGVEAVAADSYWRTLRVGGKLSVIEVRPGSGDGYLAVTSTAARVGIDDATARIVAEVFDLETPIGEISATLNKDYDLRKMLRVNPGVRVPGAWSGFELTIRAILGQQISVKAATTIAGRIARRYGEPFPPGRHAGLDRLFPTPGRLARARFKNIGIVRSRAATIRAVAKATLSGELRFDTHTVDFTRTLGSIRGIGDWTAQYVAMRVLKDADAFPASDLGLISAIAYPARMTPAELRARAEQWRPWRAYAAMLLWGSLPDKGG